MNLTSLKYIDAHSHLNFGQFDNDREGVIADMKEQGIGAINVGIDEKTSRESIALAESHDHIWASVGCHPTEAAADFDSDAYHELISQNQGLTKGSVVAVGECGLDHSQAQYRTDESKQIQEKVFISQIKLAAEVSLPLILHIRPQERSMDAYKQALDILSHYQSKTDTNLTGTAHFFVGSKEIARRFLELGFYISFTGPLTFDTRLQQVCSYIPTDRLLGETDSPFAAPEPHRGKRNTPMYVSEIVDKIAALKEKRPESVRKDILANTSRLFTIQDGFSS